MYNVAVATSFLRRAAKLNYCTEVESAVYMTVAVSISQKNPFISIFVVTAVHI